MTTTPEPLPRPVTVPALFALHLVLGGLLILNGISQRVGVAYWLDEDLWPWVVVMRWWNINPLTSGWWLVVLGSVLWSTGFGVWFGRRWAYQLAWVGLGLALAYAWPGTVLAVLGLGLLAAPATARWANPSSLPADH